MEQSNNLRKATRELELTTRSYRQALRALDPIQHLVANNPDDGYAYDLMTRIQADIDANGEAMEAAMEAIDAAGGNSRRALVKAQAEAGI